jgi:8-oxo-dGTP pyrophosphatase MutT (NUDIX family)
MHKVFAYITDGNRLLVFSHPYAPEAGIQVPAGTVHDAESPDRAAMREAAEETGLQGLALLRFLGEIDFAWPERDAVLRRRFYHLTCTVEPPARWRHLEKDPGDGSLGPIMFEFFWVSLPDGVPPLAPGHDAMLPELLESLRIESG